VLKGALLFGWVPNEEPGGSGLLFLQALHLEPTQKKDRGFLFITTLFLRE